PAPATQRARSRRCRLGRGEMPARRTGVCPHCAPSPSQRDEALVHAIGVRDGCLTPSSTIRRRHLHAPVAVRAPAARRALLPPPPAIGKTAAAGSHRSAIGRCSLGPRRRMATRRNTVRPTRPASLNALALRATGRLLLPGTGRTHRLLPLRS